MAKKDENKDIVLSPEETQAIEQQRLIALNLENFKNQYSELVNSTGFAWVIDGNSTLNNPQLGVARVNQ